MKSGMSQMASDESCDASRGGEGDDAANSGAFGAGMEHGSEGAFVVMKGLGSTGVDVDGAFGKEEARTPLRQFRAWGQGKGHVEHRFACRFFENRRGDANLDPRADCAGLRQGLAGPNPLAGGFAGKGEDFGTRARSTGDDQGQAL